MCASQKASDLFVKCLENEGVKYVFGVPGEETEDLLFSLEKSSIKFIPTRHEQGAAFMADVWGRLSGKAGVCLATLGPGATNLITGVADANLDKSPVVAITAQAGLHRIYKENHQYLDIISMFRPIVKWNAGVVHPDSIPEMVRKAFKISEEEKPGATHIELPEDVAEMKTEAQPVNVVTVRRPDPDHQAMNETVALLQKAKKPVIIAGNGAVRKQPTEHLVRFAEELNIPVLQTFMGQGAVSDRAPYSLFTIGVRFRDIAMDAMDQADLVITVGYDIAEYSPDAWNPKKDKKIIHIDFTSAEVYTHYQPVVEIVSDVPAALRDLYAKVKDSHLRFDSWYQPIRKRFEDDIESYRLKEGDRFTVPGVLHELRAVMGDDDLLLSDVGAHKIWIARNFPVYTPNSLLISNGLASMGFALPGAVAASLLDPNRTIVAAMGDGGFLMNSQELETAKRVGAKFVCVVFNDNDYGLISWKQRMAAGHATGTRLTNPDFGKYAESFGIKAYQPRSLKDLKNDLKAAISSHELCLVDIPVDPTINDVLIQRLKAQNPRTAGATK